MSEIRESKMIRTTSVETTSEERTAAALAHASTILTLLVSIASGGLGGVLFVFIPFLIYLSYKDRSRYVAFHAAQAFALQVIGTVGLFLSIIVGVLVIGIVWAIAILLTVILIGLILYPVAVLVTLAVITIWLGAPFVGMAFSLVGAVETANGRDYRYPYVGQWVEDWLKRQESESIPSV
jgi:uncharacterized Tic20 family protein